MTSPSFAASPAKKTTAKSGTLSHARRLFDWHPHDPGLRPMMRKLSWVGWKYKEMTADEQRAFLSHSISTFGRITPRAASAPIKDIGIILALAAVMSAYALLLIPHERLRSNVHAMNAYQPSNGYLEYQKAYQRRGQGRDRTALLLLASYFGELDHMTNLISEGAEVNGTNERLVTTLISAAAGCQLSAVEFLLSVGADPCLQTDEGLNAFDFAFSLNDVAVARLVKIENRWPTSKEPRDITALIAKEVLSGDAAPGKEN
jgi:hypothetical protein